ARSQAMRLHQQLWARLPPSERLNHAQTSSESEDAKVRELAVAWAGDLLPNAEGPDRRALADLLLHLSRDGAVDVQRAAVLALGRLEDARALERLRVVLHEGTGPVRAAAAWSLAQQARGDGSEAVRKQVVPLLQEGLHDAALPVVVEAAEDLATLGVAEGSAVLTGLLRKQSEAVRQAAAQALERVAEPPAFDEVFSGLADTSAKVRFSLVGALGHAAGDGRKLTASQRELLVSRLETLLVRDADP